jgi:hypothetical protein
MLLAACGGDDDGEGAAPPGTTDDGASTVGTDGTGGDEETAEGTLARYADYESIEYDDPTHWVCRPDTEDICDDGLDATVIEADGTTAVEAFTPAGDPPIDCFYVYPTISRDETTYSDWDASPEEEGYVTLQQAARLGEVCRVFAPVYRQRTLTALTAALAGGEGAGTTTPPEEGDPVADVLDAFRTYMARDNGGRGVVLIGHSQGASVLNDVIATEIDPNEDVRDLLVAAYLVGSSVAVPEGQVVGGDFAEVPLCTAGDQTGCVLTWATFRDTAPPPEGSLFGRPRDGEGVAGCVNPAAVEGGSSELAPYFPADASASILASLGAGGGGAEWLPGTEITTPFVTLPGLVRGECVERDGFTYLEVTVQPDPGPRADDIAGDLTPEWGLHLVDVSIAMGDVVDRVRVQADAFTAGR